MRSYRVVVKEEQDKVTTGPGGFKRREYAYVNRTDLGIRVEAQVPSDAVREAKRQLLELPGMKELVLRSVTIGPKNTINVVVSLPRQGPKKPKGWTWQKPPSSEQP